jgi:ATP phosphoribosyltransferase regulatory subunit
MRALVLLGAQSKTHVGGIFAPANDDVTLADKIRELREAGERVVCGLKGQTGGANEAGCDQIIVFSDGQWIVKTNK